MRNRITAVGILLSCVFLATLFPGYGFSADFPTKPIALWIGYGPGGETDLSGRGIAEAAGKNFGQPVVVINKPGGSGATMLSQLKTVKPDGYTIGSMTMGSLVASHMRKVPYECSKDFTPSI
jgi:tripartite-type tricarboxylate transporter receptor subunit TctC